MSEQNPSPRPRQRKQSSKDVAPLLQGWDYESGTISVRRITGIDGTQKVQMRLDLGLLQMELAGRPDGVRPFGCESLLEYYESQLSDHKRRNGTELGFHLTPQQCQALREEAGLYYHRYLSLYVLEDYPAVVRDTARNLRVLDLCGRYAVEEHDRLVLEQYRPVITMMNARATASILFKQQRYLQALEVVNEALEKLREFFERFEQSDAFSHSNEVRALRQFAREIRKKMPIDPVDKLRAQLDRAIRGENYEEAARLRDQISKLTKAGSQEPGDAPTAHPPGIL